MCSTDCSSTVLNHKPLITNPVIIIIALLLQFLVSKGFSNVKNVTGGIDAYAQIDRSVPFY